MTTVKKAKTAFMYYQSEMLSTVRAAMEGASMGDAMQELARRWRELSVEERTPYLQLQEEDQRRFQEESAAADQAAYEALQARRDAAEDVSGSRGARAVADEERAIREAKRKARAEAARNDDSEEAVRRREEKAARKAAAEERKKERLKQEELMKKQHKKLDKEDAKKAQSRLEYLFSQSNIFAKLQGGKGALPDAGEDDQKPAAKKAKDHRDKTPDNDDEEDGNDRHVFLTQQPSVIKGGQLKPYQLEALNWMIHLSEKGLNGILADEMGLGKTVQSIAILAYFYEFMNSQGPHLICVPKSTMSNWMNELKRWCPSLRALKFHGSREEREHMVETMFTNEAASHDGRRPSAKTVGPDGEMVDDNSRNPRSWDVCVTTYEIANMEKRSLQKFAWKYLVIDEAHRLKNDVSMFSKTVRSFRTSNRLLLTGTPLQNNLHELWALLNFLLPDIFSSAEQFDDWFDLEIDDEEAKKNIIQQLHKILRPFMLRRLKADVAKGLPPKTETILMVGMSKVQKQLYKQLLLRDIDSISGKGSRTAVLNIVMQLRKCCGHPYLFEGVEDRTLDPLGEHLVENCGKLSLLDKLLKRLKERESRVLIFTQMTRVLDIMEDFMHMRGYKYCRIDGNTTYDDREESIAAFNAPNSEKFCFILSTRAGGLGINLQTADVCVLYDSDWNPQADLQAQDRCHRLGQKKPVSVFRLVTEHTIEEKIVERAQQKLKLDAMVVQQGRLKEKDKVSKEEILAAVRFGADTIFRSEESTITDDDIDVILERGKAKTQELAEKIQKAEKGDLLDFRLDGGVSAQTFEGIDYSDKGLRDHLRLLAADNVGKRERRPPPTDYNPIISSKKSMVVNNHRIKLPKPLRVPQMEDHHFYNRERLLELGKLEFQNYAALRETNNVPPKEVMEKQRSLLPPELAQEKRELLAEGFGHWSRSQYFHFVKACATFGRNNFTSIANDMDMPVEEVSAYSQSFWKYGPTELKDEWERVTTSIERGEKKLEKQEKQSALLTKFVGTFRNPRDDMVFANRGTVHFALEQDRAILCAVEKHGYGNWEAVKEEIRNDYRLKFQHSVQGMSIQAIIKRCDYRMRQMEKEVEAREKTRKNRRPHAVVAAQQTMESMKQMDEWEDLAHAALLAGKDPPPMSMSADARSTLRERLVERNTHIARLREIEVQYRHALQIADTTRDSIYNGAQYVNYSNINMKAAGTADSNAGPVQDGVDLEATINARVLKTPACGGCSQCFEGKLCEKRLIVRERIIAEAKKGDKKKGKKRKPDQSTKDKSKPNPKKKKKNPTTSSTANNSSSGGGSRAGRPHQGNRKMVVPEELIPELCRRITANGTFERNAVINRFIEDYPSVSQRQIAFKFTELTTKEKPECIPMQKLQSKKSGRVFMAYLRPRFYKMLPESERPADWEQYAKLDDALYEQEQLEKKAAKAAAKESAAKTSKAVVEAAVAVDGDGEDDVPLVAAEVVADDGAEGKEAN